MRDFRSWTVVFLAGIFIVVLGCMGTKGVKEAEVEAGEETAVIEATAQVSDTHPEIEEGITCADCHEVLVDATTRATETWLYKDYLNFSAGEGLESNEDTKKHILSILGGKKKKNTYTHTHARTHTHAPMHTSGREFQPAVTFNIWMSA